MSRRFFLALTVIAAIATMTAAQKTIADHLQQSTGGRVTIHQPAMLNMRLSPENGDTTNLATHELMRNEKNTVGYRIQVYAGNNTRAAKNEAHAVGVRVKELFPELPVYTSFNPPRWLCRAGDFSTIEEADAVMRRLRAVGDFKAVSIVREQINIPLE